MISLNGETESILLRLNKKTGKSMYSYRFYQSFQVRCSNKTPFLNDFHTHGQKHNTARYAAVHVIIVAT